MSSTFFSSSSTLNGVFREPGGMGIPSRRSAGSYASAGDPSPPPSAPAAGTETRTVSCGSMATHNTIASTTTCPGSTCQTPRALSEADRHAAMCLAFHPASKNGLLPGPLRCVRAGNFASPSTVKPAGRGKYTRSTRVGRRTVATAAEIAPLAVRTPKMRIALSLGQVFLPKNKSKSDYKCDDIFPGQFVNEMYTRLPCHHLSPISAVAYGGAQPDRAGGSTAVPGRQG